MASITEPFAAALARPVPRYTSYPTAVQFNTEIDASAYAQWLAAVPPDAALSLYLHVPYCAQLCWYCGCHTRVAGRYAAIERYRDALRSEILTVRGHLGARRSVTQIHWGGGTPTVLNPADFTGLAAVLQDNFAIAADAEIAVEIDPRTLTKAMIHALAAAGTNRVSFGVQDFDPQVQAAINRIQPYAMTERAIDSLRAADVPSINLDLVYGLPRQTLVSLHDTVTKVIALQPDRVALFGYAHVPWMKSHQRLIQNEDLPRQDERWALAKLAAEMLTGAGYVAIGIDHFARPGDPLARAAADGRLRRNFQGYTTDAADWLLGFGASAISRFPEGYAQNAVDLPQWLDAVEKDRLATVRGIRLSADDRVRADIIERLMCDMSVDLRAVAARHGLPAEALADAVEGLADATRLGIAAVDDLVVRIEPDARPLARLAAAAFDTYSAASGNRHSAAV